MHAKTKKDRKGHAMQRYWCASSRALPHPTHTHVTRTILLPCSMDIQPRSVRTLTRAHGLHAMGECTCTSGPGILDDSIRVRHVQLRLIAPNVP